MPDGRAMIGSLGELATLPGMPSEPTLRKIIANNPDFPVLKRGKNGDAYEIDFDQAVEFMRALKAKEDQAARARADEVRQYGLELLGEDAAAATDQAGLSSAERNLLLQEELTAMKVAEKRGELIRKASVEETLGTLLVWFREKGKSFSARLARRHDVPRDLLTAIDEMMEADQHELADRMSRMGQLNNVAPTDQDDTVVRDGV